MTITPQQRLELRDFLTHPGYKIFLQLTDEALESAKDMAFSVAVSSSDIAQIKFDSSSTSKTVIVSIPF